MKRIAYTRTDGGVSIVTPALGARMVASATVDGEQVEFVPSIRADLIVRGWPSERVTDVVWAETEDDFVNRIRQKAVPADATSVMVIEESEVPVDRTFRNALRRKGSKLVTDLPIAREIVRASLRESRKAEFAELDVAYMRADERGDIAAKAAIATRKAELRDLPNSPAIDAATTVDALKALLPPASPAPAKR